MEVMFHDMERVLGKPVALPCQDAAALTQSYTQQVIAAKHRHHVDTDDADGDEAIDLHTGTGSGSSSPDRNNGLTHSMTDDYAVGQQFMLHSVTTPIPSNRNSRPEHSDDDDESNTSDTYASASDSDLLDREPTLTSASSSSLPPPPSSASSPPPRSGHQENSVPPSRKFGDMKLDDVAERWTQTQTQKQLEKGREREKNCVRGKDEPARVNREAGRQTGLKAQC